MIEGSFYPPKHLDKRLVYTLDAANRWNHLLDSKIVDFRTDYIDTERKTPQSIEVQFKNGKAAAIIIAEKQYLDNSIPNALTNIAVNEIYIFFSEPIPKRIY